MTTKEVNKIARIAGLLYLIIFFLAPVGDMFIRGPLMVPGNAAATSRNIAASEGLYRLGFVSDLIHQVIQTVLVLYLFRLLKPVNKSLALLMLVWGLVAVPIAMLNDLTQFVPLLLLSGADYLTAFTETQLQALVPLFLELRSTGVYIAFIFWGLWLFPLGSLIFKSGYLPKFLGVLLAIAGIGYLMDFVTFFLFPDFMAVRYFTFIGEVILGLWLLIKGVNTERWEKRGFEPA